MRAASAPAAKCSRVEPFQFRICAGKQCRPALAGMPLLGRASLAAGNLQNARLRSGAFSFGDGWVTRRERSRSTVGARGGRASTIGETLDETYKGSSDRSRFGDRLGGRRSGAWHQSARHDVVAEYAIRIDPADAAGHQARGGPAQDRQVAACDGIDQEAYPHRRPQPCQEAQRPPVLVGLAQPSAVSARTWPGCTSAAVRRARSRSALDPAIQICK